MDIEPTTWLVLSDVAMERVRQDEKWGTGRVMPGGTGPETFPLAKTTGRLRGRSQLVGYAVATALALAAQDATGAAFHMGCGTWWDILLEEVLEASAEDGPETLRAELVQVAAVAVAWIESIDAT